jgi:integrating conjugative element relaxase (TIGR03760 family)
MFDKLLKTFRPGPASAPPATPVPASAPKRPRVSLEEIARSPTHPVLSGRELLELLPRWPQIEDRLFKSSKVTRDQFEQFYVHPIAAFAERVQFLPASQTHHHAGPLGQLEHTLEVIENAMAKRTSLRLPLGAEPERVSREALIWTYAVFVGALGHDAGRPLARFQLRAKVGGRWHDKVSVWGESLHSLGATEYAFSWVEGADYEFHNRVAQLMLGRLLPSAGCAWLNQCPEALSQLSAWLYGDQFNCGVIGEICREADGQSAARNVGGALPGATVSESGVKMPVYKRAAMALRELARDWVVNGRAAKGATQTGGSDAWVVGAYIFVRSTVMNDLHTALVDAGVQGLPESAPGTVTKLTDAGVALSYDDGAGRRRGVFSIKVQTADGHTVVEKFTVLVFPIDQVFPLKNRPGQFDGTVEVVSPSLPQEHVLAQTTRKPVSAASVNVTGTATPTPSTAVPVGASSIEPAVPAAAPVAAPVQPPPSPTQALSGATSADPRVPAVAPDDDGISDAEAAALAFLRQAAQPDPSDDEEAVPAPAPAAAAPVSSGAMEAAAVVEQQEPVGATDASGSVEAVAEPGGDTKWAPLNQHGDYLRSADQDVDPPIMRAFFEWLRECLSRVPDASGEIPAGEVIEMNTRTALIHGAAELPQCLGLVTPKAVREFLKARPYAFGEGEYVLPDGEDAQGSYADDLMLQNILRGSRWAVHNGLAPGQNVFTYRIDTGEPDAPKTSGLNLVMLSPEAGALILPAGMRWVANPLLKRSTPEELAQARAARKGTSQPPRKPAPQPEPRPKKGKGKGGKAPEPAAKKPDAMDLLGLK